jgi:plasmid stabilization system protein ParE
VFRVEWTERARQEFLSALAFIAESEPSNSELVKERTYKTITNLASYSLGIASPKGTMKIYVQKTSYFVIFRRDADGNVKICGFIHAARDWEDINWDAM